jgi:hypothetical protein
MKRTIAAMTIAAAGLTATGFAAEVGLAPRVEIPKTPTALLDLPADFTGRAIVKFKDGVGARATGLGNVQSASGMDMSTVDDILSRQRVRLGTAFAGIPESKLLSIEIRAAAESGRAQPDLRGLMYLTGTPQAVEAAARELNDLGLVEFVEYERMRYAGDGSGTAYPHYGNWKQKAELDRALHPGSESTGIKPWAEGEGDEAFEQPIAGTIREELRAAGIDGGRPAAAASKKRTVGHDHSVAGQDDFIDFAFGGDEDPDCGVAGTGNCWISAGNGSPFCEDGACCELICEIDEFCCSDLGQWDFLCAAQANALCGEHTPNDPNAPVDPPTGPDRCAAGILAGGCFVPSFGSPGCNDGGCCFAVCEVEPFCCTGVWDGNCVELAFDICISDIDAGVTPDMTAAQGYLNVGSYEFPLPGAYPFDRLGLPNLGDQPFPGFNGGGFDLYRQGESFSDFGVDGIDGTNDEGEGNGWFDGGEPWDDFGRDRVNGTTDDGEGDGIWNEPRGIRGIAERAFLRDGIDLGGQGVQVRGKSMNIAVIDASIYRNHEEFTPLVVGGTELDGRRVIVENVRLFLDESIASPSQGTAVASVMVGRDETLYGQPAAGVRGMVPEAQGYFYAITSRDEGPRELIAWTNAIAQLGLGDLIVATYEVPGVAVTMTEAINLLATVATDSGIGVVVRAGDQCTDLSGNQTAEDLPDSGAIVVGGGSPGPLFVPGNGLRNYRLPGSNYTSSDEVLNVADARQVHLRGWGAFVTAAGFGDLFRIDPGNGTGIDPNRAYTASFSSTAAAAAQIGGLYTAVQGFHRQYFGFSVGARRIRDLLGAPGTTNGTPPRLFGNFGLICGLDILPEAPWNHIGGWPLLTGDAGVVNQLLALPDTQYNDSPFVQDVVLIRGRYIEGSVFSVRGLDGEFYLAEAEVTPANTRPQTAGPGQAGPSSENVAVPELATANYLVGGNIVDVVAIGQTDIVNPVQIGLNVVSGPAELFTVAFVEAYNFDTGRWTLCGVGIGGGNFPVPAPASHISSTGRVLARVYYVGFPGLGSAFTPSNYNARIDLIDIDILGGIDT